MRGVTRGDGPAEGRGERGETTVTEEAAGEGEEATGTDEAGRAVTATGEHEEATMTEEAGRAVTATGKAGATVTGERRAVTATGEGREEVAPAADEGDVTGMVVVMSDVRGGEEVTTAEEVLATVVVVVADVRRKGVTTVAAEGEVGWISVQNCKKMPYRWSSSVLSCLTVILSIFFYRQKKISFLQAHRPPLPLCKMDRIRAASRYRGATQCLLLHRGA